MAPKSNESVEDWKVSGITHKYPSYREQLIINNETWLKGKRKDDVAEDLWRIGDVLYDFTDFAKRHPGGAFWIEQTKGTDITEPFESHHIFLEPAALLDKYKVRDATKPRNYKFTLHENGFYKTLKRRIRIRLQAINYKPSRKTDVLHFTLLVSLVLLSVIAARTDILVFKLLAGLALCWLGNASHNYFHQKNNWQMYMFNFTLMNFTSWRISHALSHHVYPNSLLDLEMSLFEPFLCWYPNKHFASKLKRLFSVFISPIVYAAMFFVHFFGRVIYSFVKSNIMFWHDLIAFTLPAVMYFTSGASFSTTLGQWLFIVTTGSFFFGFIGLTAAHHDPRIFHDGDAVREDCDWGLFQLDTIIDRADIKGSDFLVLTHFGEHALHHLFPTLDHSVLKKLYPEFLQTLKEFKIQYRETKHLNHIIGQAQQLLRTEPNLVPPNLNKFE